MSHDLRVYDDDRDRRPPGGDTPPRGARNIKPRRRPDFTTPAGDPSVTPQAGDVGREADGVSAAGQASPAGLSPHPLAGLIPGMPEDQFEAFKANVEKDGLLHPVTLFEGMVLDGRSRLRACAELGIDLRTVEYDRPIPPLDFVLAENMQRRHLKASQRAMVGARLATRPPGRPGKTDRIRTVSLDDAARLAAVGRTLITDARIVLRSGDEDLIRRVEAGEVTASKAASLVQARDRGAGEAAVPADAGDPPAGREPVSRDVGDGARGNAKAGNSRRDGPVEPQARAKDNAAADEARGADGDFCEPPGSSDGGGPGAATRSKAGVSGRRAGGPPAPSVEAVRRCCRELGQLGAEAYSAIVGGIVGPDRASLLCEVRKAEAALRRLRRELDDASAG